jgi:eukaryotic-like serine/threonine-protein kinase
MAIAQGVLLGPYEIIARIGEGGMGEVWRARDQRIGRDVAVKVLADSFSLGDQRVARFEQEARAAGALNHPGLVTIFDVGTTEGSPYIVMELLEGQTLRELIGEVDTKPIPVRKAVDYAVQIASALAIAHEKGIIHRDLKPENIFITSDNRVKILDFGLAKLAEDSGNFSDGRIKSVRHLTSAGIVVGTPGYMSPEQVRAQPLDHRTDIFSLGSVLYEMLSGRPAFECFSAVETMHAVLNVEPPSLVTIDATIPHALDTIVRHCMEKNPRERFQSARDLAFQLRMLPDVQDTLSGIRRPSIAPTASALARAVRRRVSLRAAVITAIVSLAAGAAGFALYRAGAAEMQAPPRTFKQLTSADGLEMFPTIAPDGKSFAFVSSQTGNRDIYVQRVDGRTAINITADSPEDDAEPAFSPDGGQIAFRSEREGGGIFVMGVTGESVRRLSDFGHNPSWSPDGTRIVVSTEGIFLRPQFRPNDGKLWIIDTRNGTKRPLIEPKAGGPEPIDAVQPAWSPHGKRIAFWSNGKGGERRDIFTIDPNADDPATTIVSATQGSQVHWNPVWSPDGAWIYFGSDRDGTLNLWRIAIDEESGKTAGAPEPVSLPGAISGNFAFSQNGEMVFTTLTRSYKLLAMPFDAAAGTVGEPRMLFGGSQEVVSAQPSPDEQQIAYVMGGTQEDLFVVNADGSRLRQLTNDAARDRSVVWAPDGKTLYFYSNRSGNYHVWRIQADGSGLARVTDDASLQRIGAKNVYSPDVSPDGRTLAVETNISDAFVHLDRPPASRMEAFTDLGNRGAPTWSPDGRRLVGARNEGIVIYTPATKQLETVLPHGTSPQWLPGGGGILFFHKGRIGLFDLATRQERTVTFTPLPGMQLDWTTTLSRDGSTLFARQNVEQGDIWLVRFDKK